MPDPVTRDARRKAGAAQRKMEDIKRTLEQDKIRADRAMKRGQASGWSDEGIGSPELVEMVSEFPRRATQFQEQATFAAKTPIAGFKEGYIEPGIEILKKISSFLETLLEVCPWKQVQKVCKTAVKIIESAIQSISELFGLEVSADSRSKPRFREG